MYLGIDVGGTKTLLAIFSNEGKILKECKFPTPKKYPDFLIQLKKAFEQFSEYHIRACCCALPATIDRVRGIGLEFGRLAWENVPVKQDLESLLPGAKIMVENDAKLAGLSEALLTHGEYKNILYLTIGTGIGDGIITNGKIDINYQDSEAGQMILEHNGKLVKWEDMASGQAIVAQYGKKAQDINDPAIWREYVKLLAPGIDALVATLQPDAVIVGGGVGTHFHKFGGLLNEELKKYENKMIKMPPIIKAKRPEEAVIYGCYDYIRNN
ncbi:MAG: ROK family protein [bacterium]|nr:ROK family protein [bacterium]